MADDKSIAGKWTGRYDYAGGLAPVPFEAELLDDGGQVTGIISEPNTFAPIAAQVLRAAVHGHHDGVTVTFVKTYQGFSQGEHPTYEGQLDAKWTRIEGRWSFSAQHEWSGRFVMFRKPHATAKRRVAETVEA